MSRLILVAEDDFAQQLLVARQLDRLGWSCELADDGGQALALWRLDPGRYALLLTEVQLPRMSGIELARSVRASSSAGARLPIVACSATLDDATRLECRRVGIDECLGKPAPMALLRALLSRWQPRSARRACALPPLPARPVAAALA